MGAGEGGRRRAAGYLAPVEECVLDGEDGYGGEGLGRPGLGEGEGGREGSAEVFAVDGYWAMRPTSVLLD